MGSDLLSDIRREIDARLAQLRPAVEEYEHLLAAIAEQREQAANGASDDDDDLASAPPRAVAGGRAPGAADKGLREAILGSLEHGSHTLAELAVVTGAGTARVNRELRRLDAAGLVAKTEREGKLAWSLATAG